MLRFRLFKRVLGSAASAKEQFDARMTAEDAQQEDFVDVSAPVITTVQSVAVGDDFVEIDAAAHTPVEPGEAVVIEEDRRVVAMLGGDKPQTQILSPKECIILIMITFLKRVPVITKIARHVFRGGLLTLDDCCVFLKTSNDFTELLSILQNMAPSFQIAFCQAIGALLNDINWPTAAQDVDFEFAPVIWTLFVGLLGIAASFIQGKLIPEVLLRTEEKWIAANIDKPEYDDQKAELQSFAIDLCAWAYKVSEPTRRAVPAQRKLAKSRALHIVGYAEN